MARKIDRPRVLETYERACEIRAHSAEHAAKSATADNIWRWRGELDEHMRIAGLAHVLQIGDETVRGHLGAAVAAAVHIVRLPLESATPERRPEPDIRKTITHKPTGQQVEIEITRGPDTVAGPFTFEHYERRIVAPPGARSGWHEGVASSIVYTLAAFGSPDEAREAAAMPEAWYRSSEVLVEEAAFAGLRGLKSWILGDDHAARTACDEVVKTARHEFYRPMARAVLATMDADVPALRQTLAELSRLHGDQLSRRKHHDRYWLPLAALMFCRVGRTAGLAVDDSGELPVRFLASGALR